MLPQRERVSSTVVNRKPKRGGLTTPGDTFGLGSRPRNWLVPVILLSIRESNSYGYELTERVRAFGFEAMNTGTLYRKLRQMEEDGVVEASWETTGGGPARRMYAITEAGEAYLGFWAKSLERHQKSMDNFFRLYTGKPPHKDEDEDG